MMRPTDEHWKRAERSIDVSRGIVRFAVAIRRHWPGSAADFVYLLDMAHEEQDGGGVIDWQKVRERYEQMVEYIEKHGEQP